MTGPQKFFVSYSREDKSIAENIAIEIKKRGHKCWWDYKIVPGDIFREMIQKQINEADKVIVIWSNSSVKSGLVVDEATRALE